MYHLAGAISIYDYMVNLFVYKNENKRFHSPLDEYMSVVDMCPIDSFNVQVGFSHFVCVWHWQTTH